MGEVQLERVTQENAAKQIGSVLTYLFWKIGTAPPQVAVALSKEARKWYETMRACEENGIGNVPTCKLVEELSGRLGVERHEAYPEEPFDLHTEGPAIVLIITD